MEKLTPLPRKRSKWIARLSQVKKSLPLPNSRRTSALITRLLHLSIVYGSYLFLYLPIVVLMIFSFNTKRFPSSWDRFTLNWYQELFQAKALWGAFFTSFIIATSATLLSLTMGASLLFFRSQGGKIKKALPLFYGNLIIPETLLAISLLTYFTLLNIPLGMPTLIVAHSIFALGFVVPILYTRYAQIDPKLREVSLILGASPWQTFFKVTLPLLRPTILATGLLIFILSFDDFVLSYFCAGTKIETLSLYLLSMLRLGITPMINALSTLIFLASALSILFLFLPTFRKRLFRNGSF